MSWAGRAITDLPTALIGGATFLVLWKVRRVPEPLVIVVAGVLGSATQATLRFGRCTMAVMKLPITTGILLFWERLALLSASVTEAQRAAIDQATGAKGVYTEAEDTYKVTFPRTDIKVTVEGRPMAPFLGFSSWAAFTPGGHGGLMVMGDVVLLEDEVNPAMSAALDAGLEVTALHNHFFYESPRVMYMHIGGSGIG